MIKWTKVEWKRSKPTWMQLKKKRIDFHSNCYHSVVWNREHLRLNFYSNKTANCMANKACVKAAWVPWVTTFCPSFLFNKPYDMQVKSSGVLCWLTLCSKTHNGHQKWWHEEGSTLSDVIGHASESRLANLRGDWESLCCITWGFHLAYGL